MGIVVLVPGSGDLKVFFLIKMYKQNCLIINLQTNRTTYLIFHYQKNNPGENTMGFFFNATCVTTLVTHLNKPFFSSLRIDLFQCFNKMEIQ